MNDAAFLEAYERLNEQQRQAVDTIEGPVMVLAGPGTGKTQILALRIANILRRTQLDPQNILALTFTESGARAMRERLIKFVGKAGYYVQIYTFHSFCNRIISDQSQYFVAKRELRMLTELDRLQLLQEVMASLDLEQLTSLSNRFYYIEAVSSAISTLKREKVTAKDLVQLLLREHESLQAQVAAGEIKESAIAYKQAIKNLQKNKELARIYQRFQELLSERGYYDYDDMILFVLDAWEREPLLLAEYQERFQYILADEYQDTNTAQNSLLFKLAGYFEQPNLFVVGDDDQAIYRFQGASVENLFVFLDKYKEAERINLKDNYRSTQLILDAAHSVIINNNVRIKAAEQKLAAYHGPGAKPLDLWQFLQGEQENHFLGEQIKKLQSDGVPLAEIAVICRDNQDLSEIAEVLAKAEVPYFNQAAADLLSQDLIKIILEFWRIIVDPELKDRELVKVASQPWLGLSKLAFYKLAKALRGNHATVDLVLKGKIPDLSKSEQQELAQFANLIADLQQLEAQVCLLHFVKVFWQQCGLLKWAMTQVDSLEILRQYNSLVSLVSSYVQNDPRLDLAGLIERFQLMRDYRIKVAEQNWLPQADLVQLMTAHRSKGLEFDYVFMPKLYDGKWGNKSVRNLIKLPNGILEIEAGDDKEPNEDERRLFYVAMTRARKHIYLSQAQQYHYQGIDRETIPALFVEEIASEYVTKHNVSETQLTSDKLEAILTENLQIAQSAHSEQEIAYLQSLLKDFRMSPSALATWQRCPRQFFYQYILRLPQEYSPNLELGIVVHSVLERLGVDLKLEKQVSLDIMLANFDRELAKRQVDELDRPKIEREGKEMLTSWWEAYGSVVKAPLYTEYSFGRHDLTLDGVPLTGKIDKVELIDHEQKKVRIVDYKTGQVQSENAIRGKTKDSDGRIYQQLVFYKLMADMDPSFTYDVAEVAIDFVKPRSSGKHALITFAIPDEDIVALKEAIKVAYAEIQNLNYPMREVACECKECEWQF